MDIDILLLLYFFHFVLLDVGHQVVEHVVDILVFLLVAYQVFEFVVDFGLVHLGLLAVEDDVF